MGTQKSSPQKHPILRRPLQAKSFFLPCFLFCLPPRNSKVRRHPVATLRRCPRSWLRLRVDARPYTLYICPCVHCLGTIRSVQTSYNLASCPTHWSIKIIPYLLNQHFLEKHRTWRRVLIPRLGGLPVGLLLPYLIPCPRRRKRRKSSGSYTHQVHVASGSSKPRRKVFGHSKPRATSDVVPYRSTNYSSFVFAASLVFHRCTDRTDSPIYSSIYPLRWSIKNCKRI